jgi:type IV secretion system protein VirB9
LRIALAFLALIAAAPLAAQVRPQAAAGGDPRVQSVEYRADQVVSLDVAPGYQLMLEFAPDERIESVAVGDSAAWQVTPNRNGDRVFVKPLQSLPSNLTVVTSTRLYTFELNPLFGPSPEMAYVVRFTYPSAVAETAEAGPAALEGRYRLSGARALRPSRISDDGRHTYIEWPRDRALPAVYALDERGQEALVNGMMRDDLYVIDAVVPRLVFRIDSDVARAERVAERARN